VHAVSSLIAVRSLSLTSLQHRRVFQGPGCRTHGTLAMTMDRFAAIVAEREDARFLVELFHVSNCTEQCASEQQTHRYSSASAVAIHN
jgi:hypothetical protein